MNQKKLEDKSLVHVCGQVNTLEYTNKMLATIINNSEAGLYVTDFYSGEILYTNRKMLKYGGNRFDAETIIGKTCWDFLNFDGEGRCSFCPYKLLIDSDGKPCGEYAWEHYFEEYKIHLKIISSAIIWADGRLAHMVTFYDITEIKKMQEHLASLAYTDQFLKLKNAIKLEKDIKESTLKPSLIVFDILSMHKINEAHGRELGDSLLFSIRDWIMEMNVSDAELYRIDGDAFCLAVPEKDSEALTKLAQTIAARFEKPWITGNGDNADIHIYCNVSIALIYPEFIRNGEPVLNLIERAVRSAKSTRKITAYDKKFDKEFKDSLRFELSLKECVRDRMRGFDLYYQPIVNTVSGRWQSVEALCRWNSPEFGSVSPLVFISEAERLALIDRVGMWALETAIKKCKELGLDKIENFVLDINISAIQFTDEMLAGKIISLLDYYDYPGEMLCLEITESTRFTFTDLSLHTINKLRAKKVMVALDDFGTGYSCFNNLNKLPVDILKIERDFIINIESDAYQQHLFKAMSELAHVVKMKLITEGVENDKQVEILVKNGTDYLQGYLFSKPLSLDELKNNIHRFYLK